MEEFLSSIWLAEAQFWAIWILLAIAAWYAIPERGHRGLLRAGRYLVWAVELLGAGGLWLGGVIVNLLRQVVWGAPQSLQATAVGGEGAAPVSTISVPLPQTYVTAGVEAPHQSAPSAPSAVRPSAPSAADRPPALAVPPAVERIMVDRSREVLIDALVAAGWSTTQIRGLLRGANDAIGAEVEAARARLAAPRQTPVAGRELPAHAEFRPAE